MKTICWRLANSFTRQLRLHSLKIENSIPHTPANFGFMLCCWWWNWQRWEILNSLSRHRVTTDEVAMNFFFYFETLGMFVHVSNENIFFSPAFCCAMSTVDDLIWSTLKNETRKIEQYFSGVWKFCRVGDNLSSEKKSWKNVLINIWWVEIRNFRKILFIWSSRRVCENFQMTKSAKIENRMRSWTRASAAAQNMRNEEKNSHVESQQKASEHAKYFLQIENSK